MSLHFYYPVAPNIEDEILKILVLFDQRVSLSEWNASEAEITADLAQRTADVMALELAIEELSRMVMQVRRALMNLGVA